MRKLLLPIIAFALVLSSCQDDLTDLDEDPKGSSEAPGEQLFTNAQVELGQYLYSVNVNTNIFNLMSQYWAQNTYPDESQYDLTGRTIPSNVWEIHYRDILKDLQEAEELLEADEFMEDDERALKVAIMEIVRVHAYYNLVTTFGDIPYEEALEEDNPSPAFTDQEEVYADLLDRLETAISDINDNAGAASFTADEDVFYSGDTDSWIKFGNSLRMRMAMTVADNPPADVDPEAIVEDADQNAFESNADNAVMQFYLGQTQNPLWEALVQSGRNDFAPANTLVELMQDYNDPRIPLHFTEDPDGEYSGAQYGYQNTPNAYSQIGDVIRIEDFEGVIMGYEEVEFIRAEANARGWLDGTAVQAQQHYNDAIRADMEYWDDARTRYEVSTGSGISDGEISDYYTNDAPYPVAGSEEEQMQAIAEQKWLALYLQGHQGWVDWRRFDHPTFNVAETIDEEDEIPVRFTYPIDEQNLNEENWDEAASNIGGDETNTLLFWDTDYPSAVD
ncbi:MAG: SusD/RagB family nutrient-binding outer membrane lipoprotein [Bacteroidota bacterium]